MQIGERVYAVGASTVGARHDQTIAALALGFIDKADACAGTPDPPANCAAGWAAAVAAGHADGCCGCAAFAPSAAACPDECADAMAAGCGEYLECEGVCATCFGQYSTFFCDGETLSVGVQCNGCDAASCAQVLTEATSPQVAQYRTCANGTRMTCAADGGLTMEAFSNDTTCAGTCASAGGWSVGPMAGWCGSDDDAACPDDFSGDGLTMMPGFAWCDHGDPAYDIVMSFFGAPRCAGNATQRLPWSADGECHDAPTPLVVACNASRLTMTVWDSCDTSLNSTTLPIGLPASPPTTAARSDSTRSAPRALRRRRRRADVRAVVRGIQHGVRARAGLASGSVAGALRARVCACIHGRRPRRALYGVGSGAE